MKLKPCNKTKHVTSFNLKNVNYFSKKNQKIYFRSSPNFASNIKSKFKQNNQLLLTPMVIF